MREKNRSLIRSESGMTLIEVIVVLIILVVIISIVGGKIFKSKDIAIQNANKLKMDQVVSAIKLYQLTYSSLPPSLDALVHGSSETGSGFIPMLDDDSITDTYGHKYQYSVQDNGRAFILKSLGADGAEGGDGVNFEQTMNGP